MSTVRSVPGGPTLRAIDLWPVGHPAHGRLRQLLEPEERARLALIASIVRFKKGARIYQAGDTSEGVYTIISGVVKAYKPTSDDGEHVAAFLFADDVFGLAEEGVYENTAEALTPVTAYRLSLTALRGRLAADPALDFHVIAKLCHELRQTQRHAFLLAHKRTAPKLALFLNMLEELQDGDKAEEIALPMHRTDIAAYIGVSLSALSRTFRQLSARGVLRCRDRRHVRIVDRAAFERLIADA